MKKPFVPWLLDQAARNDHVGSLALYLLNCPPPSNTTEALRKHLIGRTRPCLDTWLDTAVTEYTKTK